MSEERQPNAELRELAESCADVVAKACIETPKQRVVRFERILSKWAQSIQAEGRQEIEDLNSPAPCGHPNKLAYIIPGAPGEIRCAMCDKQTAEQQLAEARAQVKGFCEMYDECHQVLTAAGVPDTEADGQGGSVLLSLESRIKLLAEPRAGRDLEGKK